MTLPSYFTGYKLTKDGDLYRPNQQSTWELLENAKRVLNKTDEWMFKINNILKQNPSQYGTYADNNAWSPIFTDEQLKEFIALMNQ